MKGKLINRGNGHYDLYTEKELYTSTYQWTRQGNLLSDKNCKAIENGYDLDELDMRYDLAEYINQKKSQEECSGFIDGFQKGFQKAMELMEGKKYSEQDMISAYRKGELSRYSNVGEAVLESDFIQSLQPKEWEVEIEMICPHPLDTYRCGMQYGCDEDGCNHPNQTPKLDQDGCLILKRK